MRIIRQSLAAGGAGAGVLALEVGWCRLTVSIPVLKAFMVSALEATT
jgi:hypothetical protein